jgi:hypothetical protein
VPPPQEPHAAEQANAVVWYPAGQTSQVLNPLPQFGWQFTWLTPVPHEPHADEQPNHSE